MKPSFELSLKTILFAILGTFFALSFAAPMAHAQQQAASSTYNTDDPKYQQEVERMATPEKMVAEPVVVPCSSGVCVKNAHPGDLINQTPLIDVAGPKSSSPEKSGGSKTRN